jgi:hypothetical protein
MALVESLSSAKLSSSPSFVNAAIAQFKKALCLPAIDLILVYLLALDVWINFGISNS